MNDKPLSRLSDQDLLRDLDALIVEQRANHRELDAHIAEVEARGLCQPAEPRQTLIPIGDGKYSVKLTFRQTVMMRRIQVLADQPLSPEEVLRFALRTFVAELKQRMTAARLRRNLWRSSGPRRSRSARPRRR